MPEEKFFLRSPAEYDYRKSLKNSGANPLVPYIQVNRYINRPLASLIVKAVFPTRIKPNDLTLMSFALGMLGAVFFTRGTPLSFVVGGVLAQFSSIVDCADGMLARSKNLSSAYGTYLDLFMDRISEFFIFLGISVGLYVSTKNQFLLTASLLCISFYFLQHTLFYILLNYSPAKKIKDGSELRALMILILFILAVLNKLAIGVYVLLIFVVFINLYLIVHFLQLGRKQPQK